MNTFQPRATVWARLVCVGALAAGLVGRAPSAPAAQAVGASEAAPFWVLPRPDASQVQPGISPSAAPAEARRLLTGATQAIPAEADYLQQQGVASYSIQPGSSAIVVQPVDGWNLAERFAPLGVVIDADPEMARCQATDPTDLAHRVAAASAFVEAPATQPLTPTIHVWFQPDSPLQAAYAAVQGSALPLALVTGQIEHDGARLDLTTFSGPDGRYAFYPDYHLCPAAGYDWTLAQGDVVTVTVGRVSASLSVAPPIAWLDPTADRIYGSAGRLQNEPEIVVDDPPGTDFARLSGATTNGAFDFTVPGLDGRATAEIRSLDENHNDTYFVFEAYHLAMAYPAAGDATVQATLPAMAHYTAVLSRGEIDLMTLTGDVNVTGAVDLVFSGQVFKTGDVVTVRTDRSDAPVLSDTVVPLSGAYDDSAQRYTGATDADQSVDVFLTRRAGGLVRTACAPGTIHLATSSDSQGVFQVSAALARGDTAQVWVSDADGNYQYSAETAFPVLVADLSTSTLSGYWDGSGMALDITLAPDGPTPLDLSATTAVDGSYHAALPAMRALQAGDVVRVSDGAQTLQMTVADLSARLRASTQRLDYSVDGPGQLRAFLSDFRPETDGVYPDCIVGTVDQAGAGSLTFTGARVGGQDAAVVDFADGQGDVTRRRAHARTVNLTLGSGGMSGYSDEPGAAIILESQRPGHLEIDFGTDAWPDGFFSFSWVPPDGMPSDELALFGRTVQPNDHLRFGTGYVPSDPDAISLDVPLLSVAPDASNSQAVGQAVSGTVVAISARQNASARWADPPVLAVADANGLFRADLGSAGLCQPGNCLPLGLTTYTADGVRLRVEPLAAGPGLITLTVTNGTPELMSPARIFAAADSQDWTQLPVGADTVGHVITMTTVEYGQADAALTVYAPDHTVVAQDTTSGPGVNALLTFIPAQLGAYAVLAVPASAASAGGSDSAFWLRIQLGQWVSAPSPSPLPTLTPAPTPTATRPPAPATAPAMLYLPVILR